MTSSIMVECVKPWDVRREREPDGSASPSQAKQLCLLRYPALLNRS